MNHPAPLVTIILPCLNEEGAIVACLQEIQRALAAGNWPAEVIVVDNNSRDRSAALVLDYQAHFPPLRLVEEKQSGYGFAYQRGLKEAQGRYIFMADADGTYDFGELPRFIRALQDGADLAVGNRFSGGIAAKAMPWPNRYIGNPFLSWLVRRLFRVKINDIHCGARAISRGALDRLNLCTGGMEFASEMIIKAARQNLRLVELPIAYRPRIGESKLHSLSDGWRHLRFILLYSPLFLFFLPGAALFALGLIMMAIFYFSQPVIFGVPLYTHPMFIFSVMIILGYQLILFSGFSKVYAITQLDDNDRLIESLFRHITIEKTGLFGLLLAAVGAIIYLSILIGWLNSGFGALPEIKESIIALTLLVLGIQTFFAAFMFSILGIKNK
ncbi:MAG: glycosyltransferase family 2 protein [Patescibacteria group bacterium]